MWTVWTKGVFGPEWEAKELYESSTPGPLAGDDDKQETDHQDNTLA